VRATPYSTNVEQYARVVREKGLMRQLLFRSQDIARTCYDPEVTAADALEFAEKSIIQLAERHAPSGFRAVRDVSLEVYTQAEENYRRGSDITGISTGYAKLDSYLSGLQPGDLVILAARPSMGKTSLAVCMGMNAALARQPSKVAMFSLEMSMNQLVSGMICTEAKVDLSAWRSGQLESEDWDRIAEAMNKLNNAPFFIDDSSALSPLEMRARARRLQSEQGLDMIIVDYLQLMRGNTRTDNRVNEIGEISRSLKGLAKELKVPVVALAQLSRQVESRPNKRPLLSDLRESGQIEADADVVMFIYRDSYYKQKEAEKSAAQSGGYAPEPEDDDPSLPDRTEVIIAKQRNGPTGHVDLGFFRHHKRFVTWDDHQYG
jgi:replicative DNA helicase